MIESSIKRKSAIAQASNSSYNRRDTKSARSNNCRFSRADVGSNSNLNVVVWCKKDLERLRAAAKVKTFEDRIEEIRKKEFEDQRKQVECELRVKEMLEIDNQKLRKLECKEDDIEKQKIINRVFLAKQEQEEEVKRANRIILARKCHIIRDAQVAEKHEISKELRDEESRVDKQMLIERDQALKEETKKRESLVKVNQNHYKDIKLQLDARENLRMLEAKRIECEAIKLRQASIAMEKEKRDKDKAEKDKKENLKKDLLKANELSLYLKKLQFEEQRTAELKVQEYMKTKRDQEKQLAMEQRFGRELKQKAHDHMLKLQQQVINTRSKRLELQYRIELEEVERDFRKKEKEAVVRKQHLEKEILAARATQLEEVKRQKAVQMSRDEHHFKTMVSVLQAEDQKEKEKVETKIKNRDKYRKEIIRQMDEKERKRHEQQKQAKEEYFAAIEENKMREKNIKCVIQAKIKQMRESNMPEKFIRDVERQLEVASVK